MKHVSFHSLFTRLCLTCILVLSLCLGCVQQARASSLSLVVLSQYRATMNIGDSFWLIAVASDESIPRYKSSNSRIASVNAYGTVTALKSGTCKITAKTGSGEASCKVTVKKTVITAAATRIAIERGETFALHAVTSNHSAITYKSSRKSVASVDENGVITGEKPGDATITIKADDSSKTCRVQVKKPTIQLSASSAHLYRSQQIHLTARVSSGIEPVWKSNRKSVATVDENGMVTARKHGTALISATVDGISRICEITVDPPVIRLNPDRLTMKVGKTATLGIDVSSGNPPQIKSSSSAVAAVNSSGLVSAKKPGTATITVSEDGAKEQCLVQVTK